MSRRRIAIIGAGLAGLAAAIRVAEAGDTPIVIETRKKLGGRATSFIDPRTGGVLDNCQHVLLGCCTNLIDFYDRIGVLDQIEWHRTLFWTDGRGEISEMKADWLPAPLHLARSFSRMHMFDRDDKRAIRRAMWRMIRMGSSGRLAWRNRTFAEFLREYDQPDELIKRFWNVIIISACNLDVERVSALYALQVFQDGFLANRFSYVMGLPRDALWTLYDPCAEAITNLGGEIHRGCSARSIAFDGSRVTGVVTANGMIDASAIISAVPFDRLDKLTSDTMKQADTRLQQLDQIDVSPILAVHVLFDQTIMPAELPHLVLVGFDVQWLFNKGELEDGGQHIHAVISAADDWMDLGEDEIVARVVSDIHRALPESVGLQPAEARAVKEKRATFAAVPGIDQFRPSAEPGTVGLGGGGIKNLFLAGDWCDTGWPATMEGAVRSGYAAAAACCHDETGSRLGVVDDIPTATLARVLGLK